jgi:hypothetical protein
VPRPPPWFVHRVNYFGVTKTARLARVLLALTLAALAVVHVGAFGSGRREADAQGAPFAAGDTFIAGTPDGGAGMGLKRYPR